MDRGPAPIFGAHLRLRAARGSARTSTAVRTGVTGHAASGDASAGSAGCGLRRPGDGCLNPHPAPSVSQPGSAALIPAAARTGDGPASSASGATSAGSNRSAAATSPACARCEACAARAGCASMGIRSATSILRA
ncbi:MAG: hypothetical protein C0504_01340 [Candidatus Solibacter sp.]|nr:hypothetical protein [Candidatus Solibacter sp.]